MARQLLWCLLILAGLSAGDTFPDNDRQQIDTLIRSFAATMAKAGDPAPFLSPTVRGDLRPREIELVRKSYTEFTVSDYSIDRDLIFSDANHADLKLSVSYQTRHLSQQSETTIHFEKVAGA